jgi:sugar phosphate permease
MKTRIFYGWFIAIAGLIFVTYYSGVFVFGFTAFVNPIITTFSWTYAQFSLASSLRSIEGGALQPLLGMAADRWSPKLLSLLGIIIIAAGVFCLSQTKNLTMFYMGFLIVGVGSNLAVTVIPQTLLARWFKKDLGKASSILYFGNGISGLLIPILVTMIDTLSWQTTFLYIAIGFLVLGVPLSFIFRSRPEDYGQLPDGRTTDIVATTKAVSILDSSINVKQALKMRTFWHIGITFALQATVPSVLIIYLIPYFSSIGMDRKMANLIIMLYPLVSLGARLPLGVLADTMKKNYILAITLVATGGGLFLLWLLEDNSPFWLILLFVVVFGISISGTNSLRPPIIREYFGAKNYGAISGVLGIFSMLASVVAPPLTGWVYDAFHVYKPVWLVLIALTATAVVVIMTAPAPEKIKSAAQSL